MDFKKEIYLINSNKNLSNEEKNKKIQNLFNRTNPNLEKKKNENEICFKYDKCGCKHYQRGCLMQAFCCKKFVPCRLCHDEEMDHKIDRFKTELMKCKYCNKIQSVSDKCIQCNEIMGKYFCNICKFWSNDTNKEIFHCNDCGLCRIGKREDYYHCKTCNTCIKKSAYDTHVCVKDTMHSNCSICQQDLFNSVKPVSILKCGHSIHKSCFEEYCSEQGFR